MNRKTSMSLLIAVALCAALMMVAPGCGGGGGSNPAPAPQAASGSGKVAAAVKFTGRQNGRALAQTSETSVTVTITISGIYSENGAEFPPVSTSMVVNPSQGSVTIQVLDVPIGHNHLLTASANWGSFTEVLKVIIPDVVEGETVSTTATEETTAVANAAIYYAEQHDTTLAELDADVLSALTAAAQALHASGIPYYEMTPESIVTYSQNMNVPAGVTVSPDSATVVAGETYQFAIDVVDANGSAIATLDPVVAVDPATLGTIDVTGLFTAQNAGTGILTATYESFSATAALTVVSTCVADADCGDGDDLTIDACDAPGTANAACTHTAIACATDVDCDDSNALTIDACANGGTASAACSHTPIACNTDADCSFGTPVCISGGTATSMCVACSGDTDCNDGNSLTADSCSNASTASAACTNDPYACNTNADCSAPANVCMNGGSLNSACIACSTGADCDASAPLCSSGGTASSFCYACDTDADCDDGDANNIDTCFNGGAANSVCGHSTTVPSSNITADQTWNMAGSPYIVQGQINVDVGVTLTIEPGTQVQFLSPASGSDFFGNGAFDVGGIRVDGTLNAVGTVDNPISMITASGGMITPRAAAAGQGAGFWGGIYFAGSDAAGTLQYINMDAPSSAIVLANTLNPIPISNINITNAIDAAGVASYHVFVKTRSGWTEAGVEHYTVKLHQKTVDLSGLLPDADGEYKVRIEQRGMHTAQIDAVELVAGGRTLAPASVAASNGGPAPLYKFSHADNDLIDAHEKTFDITFVAPQGAPGDVKLALTAREEGPEALAGGHAFLFPANGFYEDVNSASYLQYALGSDRGALQVDGELTAGDALPRPAFSQRIHPDSGHPDATVYGYLKDDGRHLYAAIDFTADNTMDGGADYAALLVKVNGQIKRFPISVPETANGAVGFTYTDKAGYQHKVYEFRIPLAQIGSPAPGSAIDYMFEAYGTAVVFDAVIGATYAANLDISNVSITVDPMAMNLNGLKVQYCDDGSSHSIQNISIDGASYSVALISTTNLSLNGLTVVNQIQDDYLLYTMSLANTTLENIDLGAGAFGGATFDSADTVTLTNFNALETTSYGALDVGYSNGFTCNNCNVSANSFNSGASFYETSGLAISNSRFNGTNCSGGLSLNSVSGTITGSDMSFNSYTGLTVTGTSDVTVTDCRFAENYSEGAGGDGTTTISGSNIVDNQSWGATGLGMSLNNVYLAGNNGAAPGTADTDTTLPSSASPDPQYYDVNSVVNPASTPFATPPVSPNPGTGLPCF